jgi:uncharacterized protein YbaR (Trm112 family)
MPISKELLDILACPKCKGDIYLNEKEDGLICDKCKLMYEIRDNIPIMLIDEAKRSSKRQWGSFDFSTHPSLGVK